MTSESSSASLIVVLRDQRGAIGLSRKEAKIELFLPLRDAGEAQEAHIRGFFAVRDLTPSGDYLTAKGRPPNSSRFLHYLLPIEAGAIAHIATEYFKEIHHASADEGLDITFQERAAKICA